MKMEKTTKVGMVLFLMALLVASCDNSTTTYYTGGGSIADGNNNGTPTGIVNEDNSGDNDTTDNDENENNSNNEIEDSDNNDIDNDTSEDTDSETEDSDNNDIDNDTSEDTDNETGNNDNNDTDIEDNNGTSDTNGNTNDNNETTDGNNSHTDDHQLLTSISEVRDYLEKQTNGTSTETPINLTVQIDLGTMTNAASGWQTLLGVLNDNGKYVNLDLSNCSMSGGTVFNPAYNVAIGKELIVSLTLPNTANEIKSGTSYTTGAFRYFSVLASITGEEIKYVNDNAFSGAESLNTVDFPHLVYIGQYAFRLCTSLTTITIPASATTISSSAFNSCANLTAITINATKPPTLGAGAFSGTPSALQILVPPASADAYKSATIWKNYASNIVPF